MKENFSMLAYLLASLIMIAFFAKSLDVLVMRAEPEETAVIQVEALKNEAGELKYANGICNDDAGCFAGGCSNEICSDEMGVVSTCELKPDAPNPDTYKCGCYGGYCAWIKK